MQRSFPVALMLALVAANCGTAAADTAREVRYDVVSMVDGVARNTTVRVDFLGQYAPDTESVAVFENDGINEFPLPQAAIAKDGTLLMDEGRAVSDAVDAITHFMSLESENMMGVDAGDHWDRFGPVTFGHQATHYVVTSVGPGGKMELSIKRLVARDDGTTAEWNGTLKYDAVATIPTEIAMRGWVTAGYQHHDLALAIHLTQDTFGH